MHTLGDKRVNLDPNYSSKNKIFCLFLESGSVKCGENVRFRPQKYKLSFNIATYYIKSGFQAIMLVVTNSYIPRSIYRRITRYKLFHAYNR